MRPITIPLALLLAACGSADYTATVGPEESTYIQHTIPVCESPEGCEDSTWETYCGGEVVEVPYTVCGAEGEVRYTATLPPSACDLEGRILDTWENLTRLSQRGCR